MFDFRNVCIFSRRIRSKYNLYSVTQETTLKNMLNCTYPSIVCGDLSDLGTSAPTQKDPKIDHQLRMSVLHEIVTLEYKSILFPGV